MQLALHYTGKLCILHRSSSIVIFTLVLFIKVLCPSLNLKEVLSKPINGTLPLEDMPLLAVMLKLN